MSKSSKAAGQQTSPKPMGGKYVIRTTEKVGGQVPPAGSAPISQHKSLAMGRGK